MLRWTVLLGMFLMACGQSPALESMGSSRQAAICLKCDPGDWDPGGGTGGGTPDAGTPGSGTPDAGTPGSGTPDAGTPPSPVSGLPQGMTCGLTYVNESTEWWLGTNRLIDCAGAVTIYQCPWQSWPCTEKADGYYNVFDGDFGLASHFGFYHQELASVPGAVYDASLSAQLRIPQGTVCGLQHTYNSPGKTCLGVDSRWGCPSGWVRRSAVDDNSDGQHAWVWCEYQDPNHFCTDLTCINSMPRGAVCGVTGTDSWEAGLCAGKATAQGCPTGWERHGYFDDGRPGGQGVGWCIKSP